MLILVFSCFFCFLLWNRSNGRQNKYVYPDKSYVFYHLRQNQSIKSVQLVWIAVQVGLFPFDLLIVFLERNWCIKWYDRSIITFLENPFRFSVTLKPSLEPLRTIFPWCPLGLHLGSGRCPFNQEKCLRRCGIEDRNGSLSLTQTASLPLNILAKLQLLLLLVIIDWRRRW